VKSYQSSYGWDGKIALFGKALVGALARGALPMCAMWLGFLSSFFAGGRKKQNKFPSNLYCPVKKLNYFLFQFYRYRICFICLCLTLVANGFGLCVRAGFGAQNCQPALNLNRSTKLQVCTSPRLTQNPCWRFVLLLCMLVCCPSIFKIFWI
jgi:hypothetical protein